MSQTSKGRARWHRLQGGLCALTLVGLAGCTGLDQGDHADLANAPGDTIGDTAAESPSGPAEAPDTESAPAAPAATKAAPYARDEILVRFKSGTHLVSSFQLHAAYRTSLVRAYRVPSNLHLVRLPADLEVDRALALYRSNPDVLYAEPNYRYQLLAKMPNDPSFGALWGMDNSGQSEGTSDADINAPEAWDITTGSPDVVIGVLDTGIDYNHEDLAANAFVNPGEIPGNGVDDDGNGYVDDVHGANTVADSGDPLDDQGHGTHVSGTIAGRGDNGIGVAGVSWQAKIVSCKAFGAFGASLDDILECMDYFLELKTRADNPVDIIATNNSWGGGPFSQALYDAIAAHQQAGMLFVAAAGNDFGNDNDRAPAYPASYDLDNIIAVLATDHNDQRADFSNLGARAVDVGAPGQDILSSTPGNNYEVFSGTSMATPHVTGLVGLLEAQDPLRSAQAIKNLILAGGQVTPGTEATTLSGRRIRADGSLRCQDQTLTRRFAPAADMMVVGVGSPVPLGVLSIDCDRANGEPQTVSVSPGDEVIELADASGTGRFEGSFTPPALGTYTLTFSTGDTVALTAIGNYDAPREVDPGYRTIAGTTLTMTDDSSVEVISPFPIRFAGAEAGLTTLHVSDNGVIGLTEPLTAYLNEALPTGLAETLIAPFWDDLNPSGGALLAYEVLGEAPYRELVIEWRDMRFYPDVGAASFQVVFFENNPNILFNYGNVVFGDPAADNGASATIGVQVGRQVARQHSFGQASVREGMSLLFTMGAPLATAGPDQAVLPGAAVSLDGSASQDFDGTIASYAWTQIAGEPVTLSGADTAVASFTAPETPGTLSFRIEVADDEGKTSVDTVDVVVNLLPQADAGQDYRLANGLVGTLDGTASFDPDGLVVGYRWTQLSGEPVAISNGGTAQATFTAPERPQYLSFQLEVTDEHGFTDEAVIVVEVFHNDAPLAVAGEDRVVRPGSAITLDGSASADPDGAIVSYAWRVDLCVTVDGTCEPAMEGADTAAPRLQVPDAPGLVHLSLVVTDDAGATATDRMVIGVFRQAPTARIDAGEGCASEGRTVTLDGSGSRDGDGSIAGYRWTQVAGPAVTLSGADTAVVSFTAPAGGAALAFALVVTDDDGMTGSTRIEVPVHAAPVADARADAQAVVAGATVTLDGASSLDAVSYQWAQTGGPGVVLSDAAAASPSFVAPVPGGSFDLVTLALTVTNACGATATDTVSVVVVPGRGGPGGGSGGGGEIEHGAAHSARR